LNADSDFFAFFAPLRESLLILWIFHDMLLSWTKNLGTQSRKERKVLI